MSGEDLADFWIHEVTVRTYLGTTGRGVDQYADPVTVPCFLTRKLRFVRDADGSQVPSQTSLSADTDWTATLAPRSEVTVDGRTTTVINVAESTGGTLIEGIDRVKVYLQ